jgi:hypothetical protein
MSKENGSVATQEAIIARKIITIRDERVILDVHLAEFYGVETRVLKQAVRRNKDRFPDDFMYELTDAEIDDVVSQNVIPSKRHFGGAVPFAFTENGVAMLSSVLNSKNAIEMNIAIMRTFTMVRKALFFHKDIIEEISILKKELSEHDDQILMIFEYLKQLEKTKQEQESFKNRPKIGFQQHK